MRNIETKKVRVINQETLIVTVDICKVTNFGYVDAQMEKMLNPSVL
jgi:hypothetical protein